MEEEVMAREWKNRKRRTVPSRSPPFLSLVKMLYFAGECRAKAMMQSREPSYREPEEFAPLHPLSNVKAVGG
ncbi:MAG: hypothetical protein LBB76_02045 [Azoarcus sp.]|nr:hypothetical protein [Azoarcus sp.]